METKLGHGFTCHAFAQGMCASSLPVGNTHYALADLAGGEKHPLCAEDLVDSLAHLERVLECE